MESEYKNTREHRTLRSKENEGLQLLEPDQFSFEAQLKSTTRNNTYSGGCYGRLLKLMASATLVSVLYALKGLLARMGLTVTAQTVLLREGSVAYVAFVLSFACVGGREEKKVRKHE